MNTTARPDPISLQANFPLPLLVAMGSLFLAFAAGAIPVGPSPPPLSLQSIYSFPTNQSPQGGLLLATNGNFYATTSAIGSNGYGSIFAVTPQEVGGVLQGVAGATFYFGGGNGATPSAPLIQGRDGNLYGTTAFGGISNNGTVFRISQTLSSNSFVTLVRFSGTNGSQPFAPLVAANGMLYGTTSGGGSNGLGTIFGVTASGTFTNLHIFAGTDGQNPYSGLIQGQDGNLYGTTRYGGNNGLGTVFLISPSGNFTNLASFDGFNGSDPGGLAQGSDTNFYGTTFSGGDNDLGTLFKMTPSGSLFATSLNVPDGTNPDGPLFQAGDGSFYGTALQGGTYGVGAVFRYAPNAHSGRGPSPTLLQFVPFNESDGAYPSGGLIPDANGNLFGTTSYGGDNGTGTIFELTGFAPVITRAPANVPFVVGSTATFTVAASGSAPLTFQWLLNGAAIVGATNTTIKISPLKAADVGTYSIIVSNPFGSVAYTALLTVPAPTITIKPAPPLAVTTSNLSISGTAADRTIPLGGVQFQLGTAVAAATTMNQWSNWTANLTLQPGSNLVEVWSVDQVGNSSHTNSFQIFYYLTNSLALNTTGLGKITTPRGFNTNGLIVGKTYTLTAVPASGYLFLNWTGSVTNSSPTLNFVMTPNAALTANFVTNIFAGASAVYNGLFYQQNNIAPGTAGLLGGLKINSDGSYSGKLLLAGSTFSIGGVFNADGAATNTIARSAASGGPLTLEMYLDLTNGPPLILGAVSALATNSPQWTSDLMAEPQTASRASAEYTMLLQPGRGAPVVGPFQPDPPVFSASGYALITNHAGTATIAGALPDGTTFTQTVPVSQQGDVPVYASLNGGSGLLAGWISGFSNAALAGTLTWIIPPGVSGLDSAGSTNLLAAQGALWTNPPPGTAAILLSNGQLSISGGYLPVPLDYGVSVNTANALVKLAAGPTNSLTGSINPKTGLLTLSFGNGNGKGTTTAQGAILQDQSIGAGFFTTATNAGAINLGPAN